MATERHQLELADFSEALADVQEKLGFRMGQKGMGTYSSVHEILGILQDELTEYRDEVHGNKLGREEQVQELIDIAVGAIWGIASIRSGGIDW